MRRLALLLLVVLAAGSVSAQGPAPIDWAAVDAETLKHFTAIVQIDSTDPPTEHSQIPGGFRGPFAGAPSKEDPMRADAAAWIERLAPVREFRRRGLTAR